MGIKERRRNSTLISSSDGICVLEYSSKLWRTADDEAACLLQGSLEKGGAARLSDRFEVTFVEAYRSQIGTDELILAMPLSLMTEREVLILPHLVAVGGE